MPAQNRCALFRGETTTGFLAHVRLLVSPLAMAASYGRIKARIDAGAFGAVEAGQGLGQSPFAYLANYDDLSFRAGNA